jgi:hypothetical protein
VRRTQIRTARQFALDKDPHLLERKICLKPYGRIEPEWQSARIAALTV